MEPFIEFVVRKMKADESFSFHSKILKADSIEKLDQTINTASPIAMSAFYRFLSPDKINAKLLDEISKTLYEKRDSLSQDDKSIIKFFAEKGSSPFSLFDISGNVIYFTEVLDDLNRLPERSDNVDMAVFLWIYINMYELVAKIMTDGIYEYTKGKPEFKSINSEIEKKREKGEHLSAGTIEDFLFSQNVLNKPSHSFLEGGRLFRNKIGHANIFYDSLAKKLILSNGRSYSSDEFKIEFKVMHEFLLEWIYVLNKNNTDLTKTLQSSLSELSKEFRNIERAGRLKRNYNQIIIEWKAEHESQK